MPADRNTVYHVTRACTPEMIRADGLWVTLFFAIRTYRTIEYFKQQSTRVTVHHFILLVAVLTLDG